MRVLIIGLLLLGLQTSVKAAGSCSGINTEGIYIARVDSNTNAYIKFWGKDSVLTTTSDISKPLSQKNFTKNIKKYVLHGTYTFKRCFLKMKVSGIEGKAKLEGYMIGDNLGLSKVNIQNNTYTDLIFFYKEY